MTFGESAFVSPQIFECVLTRTRDRRCMPQGEKLVAEEDAFIWMLQHVNKLYLSLSVLILLERAYRN